MDPEKNKFPPKFTAPLTVASTSITPIVVVNSKAVREQANNILNNNPNLNKSLAASFQLIKDKFDNLKCTSANFSALNGKQSFSIKNNNNSAKKHDTSVLFNSNKNLSISVSSVSMLHKQQTITGLTKGSTTITPKKDIMPSPAVPALLSPKHLLKNKPGITLTKLQRDLQDIEDRKKRCADRYDSSESSDR
ncbi:uncharacterized protein LOC134827327 isoform X2 [Culicoides brevitarsis]